jgi:CheY-like chemotaxis protein
MRHVLVVEDCPVYRQVVCEVLRRYVPALTVDEAEDGVEALAKARASSPDLVFMDLQLSGENGLDVAGRISGLNPAVAVVVVTSHDLPEYREAAAKLGLRHFLVKSTSTPKDLVTLSQQLLRPETPPRG